MRLLHCTIIILYDYYIVVMIYDYIVQLLHCTIITLYDYYDYSVVLNNSNTYSYIVTYRYRPGTDMFLDGCHRRGHES